MDQENKKLLKAAAGIFVAIGVLYYVDSMFTPTRNIKMEELETIDKDVVTVIKEVTKKNGTKHVTTTITDKSTENRSINIQQTEATPLKQNRVGVVANTKTFKDVDSYSLSYEKRLLGPVWVAVQYNTKQSYGLGVSYEF